MIAKHACTHQEAWLLLPWLANGRLSPPEREGLEEHVRECAACAQELVRERRLGEALIEPDRVTYAPGPSFRKLLARIEGEPAAPRPHPTARRGRSAVASEWRPPGLAWAASFVLAIGLATVASTAHRWSQPLYGTRTDATRAAPGVLHVAFDRSLSIDELAQVLRATGARVVEGPGPTGIFAVAPAAGAPQVRSDGDASAQLATLAARLRADARVRWVEPLAAEPEHVPDGRTRGP
jgi:hypothetical protein